MIEHSKPDRWSLIRDIAVFQVKLLVDGLRDLFLVPISLVTGVVGLLKGGDEIGAEFYGLLRLGRQSEHWINLFGAVSNYEAPGSGDNPAKVRDIDEIVARVENFIIDEYRKGGVTAQAKKRLDQAIDSLSRVTRRRPGSDS